MDGDGSVTEPGELIEKLGADSELQESWHTYCLIGDALRGEAIRSAGFVSRVMDALEHEPTVLAPPQSRRRRSSGFADRLLPVAASVMGVAVVGWIALSLDQGEAHPPAAARPLAAGPASLASAPAPASVGSPIDTHREYVFIHQASSRNGPLPGLAQYIRSVSEIQPDGRQ